MPFPDLGAILAWVQIVGYLLLFLTVAPLFPFLYVVLRWRTAPGAPSGIGTRGAMLYFCTVSSLLALAGASNLSYGFLSTTPADEAMTRLSWGFLAGSLLFLALNVFLYRRAGGGDADVRRVFLGFFAVMAGIVSLTALILFFVTAFRKADGKGPGDLKADELKLYASWAVYYLGAYVVTVARLSSRR